MLQQHTAAHEAPRCTFRYWAPWLLRTQAAALTSSPQPTKQASFSFNIPPPTTYCLYNTVSDTRELQIKCQEKFDF